MRKSTKIQSMLIIVFFLFSSSILNANKKTPSFILDGRLKNGSLVHAEIKTISPPFSVKFLYDGLWGADFAKETKHIISGIEVSVDREPVVITTHAAYSNIANIDECTLHIYDDENFSIKIQNRGSGNSYNAELIFNRYYLERKIVRHGELDDCSWEETIYSWPYDI